MSTTQPSAEALASGSSRPARRARGFSGTVSPWWILVTGVFLVVFFVIPIVNNILNSGNLATLAEQHAASFYYKKLFTDAYYLNIVWVTVVLSTGVTLLCVLIGYPVALFLLAIVLSRSVRFYGLTLITLVAGRYAIERFKTIHPTWRAVGVIASFGLIVALFITL